MACPHVSGAGGRLMDDGLSAAEAHDELTRTAEDIGLAENDQGAGLPDVANALGFDSGGDLGGDDSTDDSTEPTVTIDGVEEYENPNPHAQFDVTWSASDDGGNLDSVTAQPDDATDGEFEDGESYDVSGGSAGDTTRLRAHEDDGSGNEYEVTVHARDEAGNTDQDTASVTENGRHPFPPASRSVGMADNPTAVIHTTHGDITVELFAERAPRTVENFVGLAEGTDDEDAEVAPGTGAWEDPETGETRTDPLYEGVPFHRVIGGFMLQGGDPTGTGRGGPGYEFDDEFHPELRHDAAGTLSMANSGPDTNGSQFFITLDAQPHLDDRHAVFGQVVDGMDVVEEIGSLPTDANDQPQEEVAIESVDTGTA